MKISEVKIGNRFRKDVGDLTTLMKSIKDVGLLHPIVVSEKGELIAGFRRLKAFQLMGLEEIPATIVSLNDLKFGERDENEVRLNLNPTEAVEVERYFTPLLKVGQGKRTDLTSDKLSEVKRTREKVARKTGYSSKTLEKAKAIATPKMPT